MFATKGILLRYIVMGSLEHIPISLLGEVLMESGMDGLSLKRALHSSGVCVGKPVSASAVEFRYQVRRSDLNQKGTLYGGRMMYLLDDVAAEIAERHAGVVCATLLVDSLKFVAPSHRDDTLLFQGSVNRVWNTSLEVGIRVTARAPDSADERHIVSAYLTFVAVDASGKPVHICQAHPLTAEEKRRWRAAQRRRNYRIKTAAKK